jgi:hypothetical protein
MQQALELRSVNDILHSLAQLYYFSNNFLRRSSPEIDKRFYNFCPANEKSVVNERQKAALQGFFNYFLVTMRDP